jgi:ATP-dependent DNA ligase
VKIIDTKRLKCCTSSSTGLSRRLKDLPDETLIDGELLALGPGGKPSFNLLRTSVYYAFDILFLHRRPCSARMTSQDGDPMNTSVETM